MKTTEKCVKGKRFRLLRPNEWAIFVYSGFPGPSAKLRPKRMDPFRSRASMPCRHQSYRVKGNHRTGTLEIIPVFQFNYSVIFSFHTALHFQDSIIFLHCARGFQLGKTTQTKGNERAQILMS